jgi:hypothetical protein
MLARQVIQLDLEPPNLLQAVIDLLGYGLGVSQVSLDNEQA